jgi:adenylate cyclase
VVYFLVLVATVWRVPFDRMAAAGLARAGRAPGDPGRPLDWLVLGLSAVAGAALWGGYWRLLRRGRAWRRLRYAFIAFDVLSTVRPALWLGNGVLAPVLRGGGLTPEAAGRLAPALFVLIALSGALRLSPGPVAAAGVGALLGQAAVGALLGTPPAELVPELGVLALVMVLGGNFVFVLREMAFRAATEAALERYIPQGLAQRLAEAGGVVPPRVAPVTILIADIRGFTALAEPLGPHEAVALLNDYFATIVAPLAAEGAVLDKYLGDGLLAFLEGPEHAARGLRAAHGIVLAMHKAGAGAPAPGGRPGIGVAVHSAEAFVGCVGAPARMEYTVIGDAVNVTARLEGLMSSKAGAERLDAALVASAATVEAAAAGGVGVPGLVGPRPVAVHGRQQALAIYYLPVGEADRGERCITSAAAVD